MALCPSSTLKKNRYRIRTLDELIRLENVSCIKISPCATMVGLVSHKKTVKILQLDCKKDLCKEMLEYISDFHIEGLKWSENSMALLVFSLKVHQFVVIRDVKNFDKECIFRVQEPQLIDLISIEWVPDSKHIISLSDCNIFTFIHSLYDGRRILIPSICSTINKKPLMAFSYNGKYVAYIHYQSSGFHVVLLSTYSWKALWRKKLEFSLAQGLEWSPDSTTIALWDHYKRVITLELNGDLNQAIYYQDSTAIGFLTVMFSPKSDLFLAVCIQNKVIVLLIYNTVTWRLCASLDHSGGFADLSDCTFSMKNQVGISNCGNLVASSLLKGSVFIWNVRDGCELCRLINTQNNSAGLKWHCFKTELVIATEDGVAFVWKHPQEGPVVKRSSLYSATLNLTGASDITWSKKCVVFSTSQHVTIMLKVKKN